jgi:hypothetical protein
MRKSIGCTSIRFDESAKHGEKRCGLCSWRLAKVLERVVVVFLQGSNTQCEQRSRISKHAIQCAKVRNHRVSL